MLAGRTAPRALGRVRWGSSAAWVIVAVAIAGGRGHDGRSLLRDGRAHPAPGEVIVHQTAGLHERIGGRGTDEAEAESLELARQRLRFRGRCRNIGSALGGTWPARRERPGQLRERLELPRPPGVLDRGL